MSLRYEKLRGADESEVGDLCVALCSHSDLYRRIEPFHIKKYKSATFGLLVALGFLGVMIGVSSES